MAKAQVVDEHREYFLQNKVIEFEELLSNAQLEKLRHSLESALAAKMQISHTQFGKQSSSDLYKAGYDLWRENEGLKKLIFIKWWAEIAGFLTRTRTVRLLADQLFINPPKILSLDAAAKQQTPLLIQETKPLKECFSFQGLIAGLLLCLEKPSPAAGDEIPRQPGNGVFFAPDAPFPMGNYVNQGCYLLILYGEAKSQYIHNSQDVHCHELKKYGYVFGDKLEERTHPTLYR